MKKGNLFYVFMICFFAISVCFVGVFAYALPVSAQTLTVEQRRAQLEQEKAELEAEITKLTADLEAQKKNSGTIKTDISILTNKIAQVKLEVKKRSITISQLSDDIDKKATQIESLSERIENQKASIAGLLRKTNELDSTNVVYLALGSQTLSSFYADVDDFTSLQKSLKDSVDRIKGIKVSTEIEKKSLETSKNKVLDEKKAQELAQKDAERKQKEKDKLLSLSKQKEKEYETYKKEKEKRKAQILAELFALRDTAAIPFGKAYEYAKEAEQKTGVRPAFLLAILKQESALGANIGTCNRPGDPPSKRWDNIMKPSRDQAPYLRITSALGLGPETMPLSCPQAGGWGGGRGPAQFIPSTRELIPNTVAKALG